MNVKKLIFSITLFLSCRLLSACPLCQGGDGISLETIHAYKSVTLFLALLPILGGAGIFYWIYKRYQQPKNTAA